jgi:hypothetical protein
MLLYSVIETTSLLFHIYMLIPTIFPPMILQSKTQQTIMNLIIISSLISSFSENILMTLSGVNKL